MRIFFALLLCATALTGSFLVANPANEKCPCANCGCSVESDCGCCSNKPCSCSTTGSCAQKKSVEK